MKRKTYRHKRTARARRNTRRRGGSNFLVSLRPSQLKKPGSNPDVVYKVQRYDNGNGKSDCFTRSAKKAIGYVDDWLMLLSKGPKYIPDPKSTYQETFEINDK